MEKFPQLQSGFLGSIGTPLQKFAPVSNPFVDYTLDLDHLKANIPYFYSPDVTKLYQDVRAKPERLKDLAYVRHAIQLAKLVYAQPIGKSVNRWFNVQSQSPSLTPQHIKFLEETLAFVILGKPRTVMMDLSYIYMRYTLTASACVKCTWMDLFSHRTLEVDNFSRADEFISAWLSRPEGLMDMIFTMWITHGIRDRIQDLSEKSAVR